MIHEPHVSKTLDACGGCRVGQTDIELRWRVPEMYRILYTNYTTQKKSHWDAYNMRISEFNPVPSEKPRVGVVEPGNLHFRHTQGHFYAHYESKIRTAIASRLNDNLFAVWRLTDTLRKRA